MANHDLLNKIIRASAKLTSAELEMLLNTTRRQKEEADRFIKPDDAELCILNDDDDHSSTDGLCIKKI